MVVCRCAEELAALEARKAEREAQREAARKAAEAELAEIERRCERLHARCSSDA
jgi:hypothetical protein